MIVIRSFDQDCFERCFPARHAWLSLMTCAGLDNLTEHTFHPMRTHRIAEEACRWAGLDAAGAVLLRHQTNAVYRLTTAPVVVKVARPSIGRGKDIVLLVQWLAEQAIPIVSLATDVEQPLELAGCEVTLWCYFP